MPYLTRLAEPHASSFVESVHRRHDRSRFASVVPQLIVRVSYRGASASDAALFDGTSDSLRWLVPYGVTLEARLSWSFDRIAAPPPPPAIDPDDVVPDNDDDAIDAAEEAGR